MKPQDYKQVTAYLDHLATAGHPATTVRTYRYPLLGAARALPDGLCSEAPDIHRWLASFRNRNTRASYECALRGFYRWAYRTRRISEDPTVELAVTQIRRGLPRPISHDELAELLAGARQPIRLWCQLAALAGARCIEISRVERRDVTAEVTYLHGKGDRRRAVPTHPELWETVRPIAGGPLAGCSPKQVSKRISQEAARLGLSGVTAHRLRHWAGTWWHAATGDVRVTQELLGHASPATTAVYTAVSDQAKRAAVLALPLTATAAGAPPAGAAAEAGPGTPAADDDPRGGRPGLW